MQDYAHSRLLTALFSALCVVLICPPGAQASGQDTNTGIVRGTVTVRGVGSPVQMASVTILQLGRSTSTDAAGKFEFTEVPPGEYNVISHMHALTDEKRTIIVTAEETVTLDFQLSIAPIRNEVTVTASGKEETTFDTFQAVSTVDSLRLTEKSSFGLGEVVGNESGVNKRSFGPGSARPVVRGFDGDRVLVLADGLPTGTLSSQSGEHAEPIDAVHLERVEIVKGPATLLYGSNAIGGVVNAVTEHHLLHEHPHAGLRGQVTTQAGTNNNSATGHANVEYGYKNWLIWGSGSRQVAGDYSSPAGRVDNSQTRMTSGSVGFGWFSEGPFVNLGYSFNKGRMGIPFAGEFHHHEEEETGGEEGEEEHVLVDETFTWQNVRFNTGMHSIKSALLEEFHLAANFTRWMHREVENEITATAFDNQLVNVRATFKQRERGRLTGTSGVQLFHRDYAASGEEALSPPATGKGFAAFTLQEIGFGAARFQFGGRIDYTGYKPAGLPTRSFTGASGAAGIHLPTWKHGALVANYTHSSRAPAIEELYNHGAHIGNLAFEIGNPNLEREVADGIDFSVRHAGSRFDAEANLFYYHINDFVYLNFTGETEHGLRVAEYSQADSRFLGGEAKLDVGLRPNLWLNSGLDFVDADLAHSGTPLPRIPPLRARLGLDARLGGFSFKPEIVMADDQDSVSPTETRTPGYTVVNLNASYILATSRLMHVFSVSLFNAGDALYRNHLSFIKDLAPEMGRAFRFTYSVRLF
jgi:iron complex outermembrane receptor protein